MANLRLISSSDDLSAGRVLAGGGVTELSESGEVYAALALYLNWPGWSKAFVVVNGIRHRAVITADPDEAEPSELRISLSDERDEAAHNQIVVEKIFFEVFNVAYEFIPIVVATRPDSGGFDVIVSLPQTLRRYRNRSIPRVRLGDDGIDVKALNAQIKCRNGTVREVSVLEFGLHGVVVELSDEILLDEAMVKLVLFGLEYDIFEQRSLSEHEWLLLLRFSSITKYNAYFETFSQYAYPSLRKRVRAGANASLQAFIAGGFLEKFATVAEASTDICNELLALWSDIDAQEDVSCFDMCSMSKNGAAVGSSSLVKGFVANGEDQWVITQMTVDAKPEYFDNTADLYLWRAGYLYGLPGRFGVICWYDSKSRFIERLWIKFIRQAQSAKSAMWPVIIKIVPREFIQRGLSEKTEAWATHVRSSIAGHIRYHVDKKQCFGAIGPYRLNAVGLLDHVLAVPPDRNATTTLHELASELCQSASVETPIRITYSHDAVPASVAAHDTHQLDRLCTIDREDLPFLHSSVVHSLAVMRKKFEDCA